LPRSEGDHTIGRRKFSFVTLVAANDSNGEA
jgi:hypothetical protein